MAARERGSAGAWESERGSGRKQKLELRSIMSSEMDLFSSHRCDCPELLSTMQRGWPRRDGDARPSCQQRRASKPKQVPIRRPAALQSVRLPKQQGS